MTSSSEGHPPLCKGTKQSFSGNAYGVVVFFDKEGYEVLASFCPEERPFIARYQACAWQDRAKRWLKLSDVYYDKSIGQDYAHEKWALCNEAYNQCSANAEMWREWESIKEPQHGRAVRVG